MIMFCGSYTLAPVTGTSAPGTNPLPPHVPLHLTHSPQGHLGENDVPEHKCEGAHWCTYSKHGGWFRLCQHCNAYGHYVEHAGTVLILQWCHAVGHITGEGCTGGRHHSTTANDHSTALHDREPGAVDKQEQCECCRMVQHCCGVFPSLHG